MKLNSNFDGESISIVIPCFNEESNIATLYGRVIKVVDTLHIPYELILVDDGSKDKTWENISMISEIDPHLVAVKLSKNHGHQLALCAGLSLSKGKLIAVLDADLQDPPELLPQMIEIISSGVDVVYGKRKERRGESSFKLLSAFMFYRIINFLSDVTIPKDTGDFRVMTRRVVDIINSMPENQRFIRGMVSWVGFNQRAFLYERDPRFSGFTSYSLKSMMGLALDAITGFSVKPLRLASYLGVFLAFISLMALTFILFQYSAGKPVAGWTSIISVQILLGSIQLIVLGVMGEYLGRIYTQSKARPLFIIEDVLNG